MNWTWPEATNLNYYFGNSMQIEWNYSISSIETIILSSVAMHSAQCTQTHTQCWSMPLFWFNSISIDYHKVFQRPNSIMIFFDRTENEWTSNIYTHKYAVHAEIFNLLKIYTLWMRWMWANFARITPFIDNAKQQAHNTQQHSTSCQFKQFIWKEQI